VPPAARSCADGARRGAFAQVAQHANTVAQLAQLDEDRLRAGVRGQAELAQPLDDAGLQAHEGVDLLLVA
jgi:hypothetical protein